MCVYIYIYIYVYIHTYTYIYIQLASVLIEALDSVLIPLGWDPELGSVLQYFRTRPPDFYTPSRLSTSVPAICTATGAGGGCHEYVYIYIYISIYIYIYILRESRKRPNASGTEGKATWSDQVHIGTYPAHTHKRRPNASATEGEANMEWSTTHRHTSSQHTNA